MASIGKYLLPGKIALIILHPSRILPKGCGRMDSSLLIAGTLVNLEGRQERLEALHSILQLL